MSISIIRELKQIVYTHVTYIHSEELIYIYIYIYIYIAHKTNIPGRPVVSSVECHTSKIFKFVDHYLQPHAKSLPSYIKDTSDFINRINEAKDIKKDTILVTLDVKSLYTNIPNHEGIEAVKSALNSVSQKLIATKEADC